MYDAYICDPWYLTMLHVCMMRLKFCHQRTNGQGDSRSRIDIDIEATLCSKNTEMFPLLKATLSWLIGWYLNVLIKSWFQLQSVNLRAPSDLSWFIGWCLNVAIMFWCLNVSLMFWLNSNSNCNVFTVKGRSQREAADLSWWGSKNPSSPPSSSMYVKLDVKPDVCEARCKVWCMWSSM